MLVHSYLQVSPIEWSDFALPVEVVQIQVVLGWQGKEEFLFQSPTPTNQLVLWHQETWRDNSLWILLKFVFFHRSKDLDINHHYEEYENMKKQLERKLQEVEGELALQRQVYSVENLITQLSRRTWQNLHFDLIYSIIVQSFFLDIYQIFLK